MNMTLATIADVSFPLEIHTPLESSVYKTCRAHIFPSFICRRLQVSRSLTRIDNHFYDASWYLSTWFKTNISQISLAYFLQEFKAWFNIRRLPRLIIWKQNTEFRPKCKSLENYITFREREMCLMCTEMVYLFLLPNSLQPKEIMHFALNLKMWKIFNL